MLRQLSSYFYKEPGMLFLVRVSQGLVHLGKGLLGLSPHHTDGQLLNGVCAHHPTFIRLLRTPNEFVAPRQLILNIFENLEVLRVNQEPALLSMFYN